MMTQVQQQPKTFTCFGCKQEIKLKRKEDNSGWLKFDTSGNIHDCTAKKNRRPRQQLQEQQQENNNNNTTTDNTVKEITAVKAQLLVLVGRLDHLERELQR